MAQDSQALVEKVRQALSTVMDPELHRDLVSLNMVRDIQVAGSSERPTIQITLSLTTPACPLRDRIQADVVAAVQQALPQAEAVAVDFDSQVQADPRIAQKLRVPIKNIVAVASGKGGVGKSTISVNLAVSLALEGAKVGLLDADIYGPNIPMMMGVEKMPPVERGKIVPAQAHGVEFMSMGFLLPPNQALIWRGPMLHKAIQQLFTDVRWGELDYLIVDLPPGTGDAQLSLAQIAPLTGGIIVTMPQMVSVADARRGAAAFQQLAVPILGVIENMAGDIFGEGGGEVIAQELGTEFLGRVPLDPQVRVGGDTGQPIVIAHPESPAAQALRTLARKLAAQISILNRQQHGDPELRII